MISRRTFVRGSGFAAALFAARASAQKTTSNYAYVGCYTSKEREGHGDGIHAYRLDPESGAWTHIQRLGDLFNPSFLIVSRDQRFLYSVHGDGTYASSFSIDGSSGFLTPLNRAATGGSNGVHQAIDPSGRYMLVANYASGTVAVLPVRGDGALQDQVQLVELQGQPGPHRAQQASSHPHCVVFDPSGRFVLVPDKGLDRIFIFRFDATTGKLSATEQGSVAARSGYAPRHLAFHPTLRVVWVLNEIGNATTTYAWDGEHGALRSLQILPTLPPDFTGENTAAEIAVGRGGRFVYCSNRGHSSIAVYSADPKTGLLTPVGWESTRGKVPRFIALDPSRRFLYAANEESDTVVHFRVNPNTGRLTRTEQTISNLSPVTIAFAGA
jgi:6-phosphogluconolactonase (cycloisomerase 2 family)